ncbi:MAG: hypothetical protein HY747_04175 [Elusimicrobia bacterium]|nr:hypothetical protein [Elusimicrobiota bacterium]
MIKINLIPLEYIQKQKRAAIGKLGAVFGGTICVGVLAVSSTIYHKSRTLAKHVQTLEARLKQLEEVAREVDALEAKKSAILAKNTVVGSLLAGRLDYPKIMEAVVKSLPPNQIWIGGLTTMKTSQGYDLNIPASTLGMDSIIQWLQTLESSPGFSNISIGAITNTDSASTLPMKLTYKP